MLACRNVYRGGLRGFWWGARVYCVSCIVSCNVCLTRESVEGENLVWRVARHSFSIRNPPALTGRTGLRALTIQLERNRKRNETKRNEQFRMK